MQLAIFLVMVSENLVLSNVQWFLEKFAVIVPLIILGNIKPAVKDFEWIGRLNLRIESKRILMNEYLNRLASEATPGPWRTDSTECCVYALEGNDRIAQIGISADGTSADARFIAEARSAVPELLAILEDLIELDDWRYCSKKRDLVSWDGGCSWCPEDGPPRFPVYRSVKSES
jgi:hypothetical protein